MVVDDARGHSARGAGALHFEEMSFKLYALIPNHAHSALLELRAANMRRGRTVRSFADWLREAGLERYAAVFAENDIDILNARTLREEDLRELGLTLGHRKNFLAALAALEASIPARPTDSAAAAPAAASAVDPLSLIHI